MSVITTRSGTSSLTARMARLPILSGSHARAQSSVRLAWSEWGKMQIAGMFSRAARSAARRAPSRVRRSTPGIEAISPSAPATSVTKIGQIRLAGVRFRSDTIARMLALRRSRRRRPAGKGAMMGLAMGASCLGWGNRAAFPWLKPVLRSRADKDKELPVPQFDNLIGLLGSRSFSTIWFWLVLIGMWSVTGRSVIGIPSEVLARARAALAGDDGQGPAVITLLDWLSLILPRWQLRPREGAAFLGVTSFLMTSLAVLGFVFWLEMAQALTLLLLPFWALFWMRVRLARRLVPLVHAAQEGRAPVSQAAGDAARAMVWHKRFVTILSMIAVAVTALWGALWTVLHPVGF